MSGFGDGQSVWVTCPVTRQKPSCRNKYTESRRTLLYFPGWHRVLQYQIVLREAIILSVLFSFFWELEESISFNKSYCLKKKKRKKKEYFFREGSLVQFAFEGHLTLIVFWNTNGEYHSRKYSWNKSRDIHDDVMVLEIPECLKVVDRPGRRGREGW